MAHRYSAGIDNPGPVGAGGVYAEMLAGAVKSVSCRRITVTTGGAGGGVIALVRSSAIGTGAATGIATCVAHRLLSPTTPTRLQVAWTSSGVTPTGYVSKLRQVPLPLATGTEVSLWRPEDGPLVIEPNSSLLVVNQGSGINGSNMHVNFMWEEGPASEW